MAGIKTRNGQIVAHRKYYHGGKEYRPCLVICRKISGNGYKKMMSANCLETGEVVKNHQGRAMPWAQIKWD